MIRKTNQALFSALALLTSASIADTIVTKDGSTINGDVVGIDKGKVTVQTEFAGTIVVEQSLIASLETDNPLYLTVQDGSTYLGPVSGSGSRLAVETGAGEVSTTVESVQESWRPGAKSPTTLRQEAAMEKLQRKWAYEAAFDLNGKSGNKSATGLASAFRAKLKGPNDALEFFAKVNYSEVDDSISANDTRAGVDYTNQISDTVNWYVRSEIGRDEIKDIELFVTGAGGFGYTFMDTETRTLNVRGGLGYLFESYDDTAIFDANGNFIRFEPRENTSSASIDFGIFHKEVYTWGTLVNRLTYTPTLEDLGNYRLIQDSSLDIPLKAEGWSVRVGIANSLDSQAEESGKENLDTTYYLRMVLKWD